MINKKLLIAVSLAISIATSSAFAKTEGNYAGLDLIRTDITAKYKGAEAGSEILNKDFNSNTLGAHYRYAFNANNFFIAPGLFIEETAANSNGIFSGLTDNITIQRRYGLKADIGYDLTDGLSIYFTNGLSVVNYEVDWNGAIGIDEGRKSGNKLGYFYGGGIGYNFNKSFAMNVEYNTQSLDLDTPDQNTKAKIDLSAFKLGASYRF